MIFWIEYFLFNSGGIKKRTVQLVKIHTNIIASNRNNTLKAAVTQINNIEKKFKIINIYIWKVLTKMYTKTAFSRQTNRY